MPEDQAQRDLETQLVTSGGTSILDLFADLPDAVASGQNIKTSQTAGTAQGQKGAQNPLSDQLFYQH